MILEHCQWHPQLVADLGLGESDVKAMAKELVKFHQQFHEHFGRIEHQRLGLAYMSGLMRNADAKSVEPIALEFLNKASVRSLQMFMKDYRWNHQGMQIAHQGMLAEMISRPDGMMTVDSCEFPKKGKESVGVARWAKLKTASPVSLWAILVSKAMDWSTVNFTCPKIGFPKSKNKGVKPIGFPKISFLKPNNRLLLGSLSRW